MLLAVAQVPSTPLDVPANVARHADAVGAAAPAGARVVLFPELSLTGYELAGIARDGTQELHAEDERLAPLREECRRHGVAAVAGAPTRQGRQRRLSVLAVGADGAVTVYDKRNLFGHEKSVFTAGAGSSTLALDGRRLALGICFDLGDDDQALAASDADAWLLGVLLSAEGYAADAARAADVARRHRTPVVLANHASRTGGWSGAGGSGVWRPDGSSTTTDPAPGTWVLDLHDPDVRVRVG